MQANLLALALLAGLFAAGAGAQAPSLTLAVTEGVTYQATPKEIRDRFTPLAEYVGKAAGKHLKVVLVPAYDDLRAGLAKQEYDLAFVHPAHVAMAEIKSGRYRAIAWTSGFTDYTVSLLTNAGAPLKTLDDLRGNTVVTPDPDSITAVMVRAMFRTGNLTTTDAKPPPATAARVITTRYQDAVPFYLDHGFAQVGATAAKGGREVVDRQGRRGADAVALGADQAVDRVDPVIGRRAGPDPRGAPRHEPDQGWPRGTRGRRIQGFRRAQPRRRGCRDQLARALSARATPRPGRGCRGTHGAV